MEGNQSEFDCYIIVPRLAAVALDETINGLYKAEVIYKNGPWKNLEDVEMATLTWVEWFNNRRIYSVLDYVPPAEYEANFYDQTESARVA